MQYFQRTNRDLCPIKAFAIDLVSFIKNWMQNSFEIILCIDGNKNMHSGRLAKEFKKLGLVESTSRFTSGPPPNTFIIGRHQIDTV